LDEAKQSRQEIPDNQFDDLEQIIDWLEKRKDSIPVYREQLEKIQWLGKPAEFGFLFKELAEKGWIQVPVTNHKESKRMLAKLCFEYFDTGTESFNSLYQEFTKRGSLTEGGQLRFQIKENKDK
jgi:hypothetical protein